MGGSENDRTSADGFSAEGTKHRTISGTIKELFKAAKAITGGEDEPEPERRRAKDGGSEGGMMRMARQFSHLFTARQPHGPQVMRGEDMRGSFRREARRATRADTTPVDYFEATGAGWSDTLALLGQWNDEALAADFDDSFENDHKCDSPGL